MTIAVEISRTQSRHPARWRSSSSFLAVLLAVSFACSGRAVDAPSSTSDTNQSSAPATPRPTTARSETRTAAAPAAASGPRDMWRSAPDRALLRASLVKAMIAPIQRAVPTLTAGTETEKSLAAAEQVVVPLVGTMEGTPIGGRGEIYLTNTGMTYLVVLSDSTSHDNAKSRTSRALAELAGRVVQQLDDVPAGYLTAPTGWEVLTDDTLPKGAVAYGYFPAGGRAFGWFMAYRVDIHNFEDALSASVVDDAHVVGSGSGRSPAADSGEVATVDGFFDALTATMDGVLDELCKCPNYACAKALATDSASRGFSSALSYTAEKKMTRELVDMLAEMNREPGAFSRR